MTVWSTNCWRWPSSIPLSSGRAKPPIWLPLPPMSPLYRAARPVARPDGGGDRRKGPGRGCRQRRHDRARHPQPGRERACPNTTRRSCRDRHRPRRDRARQRSRAGRAGAEREQIFRRFWRRDRRRPGSAGLGLSIVARIAEMHGATIEVADRPGGGAVFALAFPCVIEVGRQGEEAFATAL